MKHTYWGNVVKAEWSGFIAGITFSHPFFENRQLEIFLGPEFDEDGEEIEEPPTAEQLDAFAATYRQFIDNIEANLKSIQEKAYERYLAFYAHYYENPGKSGEPALGIDSVEKHNNQIRRLVSLRLLDGDALTLAIRYKLDTEHGLEFRFENGKIVAVGGISGT